MPNFSLGDSVLHVPCPKCKKETVIYNGNYFCSVCPWAMSERRTETNKRIIATYLVQRMNSTKSESEKRRMREYLSDYDGVIIWA